MAPPRELAGDKADAMTETRSLSYVGPPALASALVQMLEEEGLTVEWTRPDEQRGMSELADGVVIGLVIDGAKDVIEAGVRAAVARFRKRFPGAAKINDDEPEGGKHEA